MNNKIHIVVMNLKEKGALARLVKGEKVGTIVSV